VGHCLGGYSYTVPTVNVVIRFLLVLFFACNNLINNFVFARRAWCGSGIIFFLFFYINTLKQFKNT
jgi:hypothetical protein